MVTRAFCADFFDGFINVFFQEFLACPPLALKPQEKDIEERFNQT